MAGRYCLYLSARLYRRHREGDKGKGTCKWNAMRYYWCKWRKWCICGSQWWRGLGGNWLGSGLSLTSGHSTATVMIIIVVHPASHVRGTRSEDGLARDDGKIACHAISDGFWQSVLVGTPGVWRMGQSGTGNPQGLLRISNMALLPLFSPRKGGCICPTTESAWGDAGYWATYQVSPATRIIVSLFPFFFLKYCVWYFLRTRGGGQKSASRVPTLTKKDYTRVQKKINWRRRGGEAR